MERTVWRETNGHITVRIVTSNNWLRGQPKNPQIPKWLVHIEFCPTDEQLSILEKMFDSHSMALIRKAFHIKEKHNRANLTNPEDRTKEDYIGRKEIVF